jgi:hypothetical protein
MPGLQDGIAYGQTVLTGKNEKAMEVPSPFA